VEVGMMMMVVVVVVVAAAVVVVMMMMMMIMTIMIMFTAYLYAHIVEEANEVSLKDEAFGVGIHSAKLIN
jgi:hypothetical protein